MGTNPLGWYGKYGKRIFDFSLAALALILLIPVFLVVAILVRTKLGSPILFVQERPGYQEKIFKMYKFRTMTDERDVHGELLSDQLRLTRFGKFLRSTSLDELPELINILKGDMSFVGPRPLLVQYLPLYNEKQKKRHHVRPGLSGLAQISGRNAISWEEKFELDVRYVDKVNLRSDLFIILLTLKKVLIRDGISSATAVTMEPFQGSQKELGL
ncbi:sugar transferase [Paenibacillus sp. 1P07SE]|uniref:sugar transferase n=1 Tax=Paenibacillus sp. 1P07SE TaxID=3132209 RepID=UPI0039A54437